MVEPGKDCYGTGQGETAETTDILNCKHCTLESSTRLRVLKHAGPTLKSPTLSPPPPHPHPPKKKGTHRSKQVKRQTLKQTDMQADRETNKPAGKQTDQQTEKEADSQPDRPTGRHKNSKNITWLTYFTICGLPSMFLITRSLKNRFAISKVLKPESH